MPQVGPVCHPQRIFSKIGVSCFLLVLASRWFPWTWKVRFKGSTVWFSGRFQGLNGGLFLSVHSLGFGTQRFPRETVEPGKITLLVPPSLPLLCSPGESAQ